MLHGAGKKILFKYRPLLANIFNRLLLKNADIQIKLNACIYFYVNVMNFS